MVLRGHSRRRVVVQLCSQTACYRFSNIFHCTLADSSPIYSSENKDKLHQQTERRKVENEAKTKSVKAKTNMAELQMPRVKLGTQGFEVKPFLFLLRFYIFHLRYVVEYYEYLVRSRSSMNLCSIFVFIYFCTFYN